MFFIAFSADLSMANGLDSLENFIKNVRSGRSDFVQTVTSPTRPGEAPRIKSSSGIFEFQRPGKFKFQFTIDGSRKPNEIFFFFFWPIMANFYFLH